MSQVLFEDARYTVRYIVQAEKKTTAAKLLIIDHKYPLNIPITFTKEHLMKLLVDIELFETLE